MPLSAFDFDVNQVLGPPVMSSSPASNPSWQARYEELLQWRAANGDTCVPKAEGALGRWVARQRELKRSGSMSKSRPCYPNNFSRLVNEPFTNLGAFSVLLLMFFA